jgi:hypothetical protein
MAERELVVGESEYLGNTFTPALIVLPRSVALGIAERVRILGCKTWGAVRADASPDVYQEVLELAGYGSFEDFAQHLSVGAAVPGALEEAKDQYERVGSELPDDGEPFDAYRDVSAFADGDWPVPIQLAMHDFLPRDIVERYGTSYETNFNGTFVELDAQHRAQIIADLEREGFTCREDPQLIAQLMPV